MATWVMDGMDIHRGQLVSQGFTLTWPRTPVYCRWMGGPARSGVRRAIFTCQDRRAAEVGYQVTHAWWAYVSWPPEWPLGASLATLLAGVLNAMYTFYS